jgi:hypothetical protein
MKILDDNFPPKQNQFSELYIQQFIEQAKQYGAIRIRNSTITYYPELGLLSLKAPDGKYCITTEHVIVTIIHSGIRKIGNLNLRFKTIPELITIVRGFHELMIDSSHLHEYDRKVLADMVKLRSTNSAFNAMLDAYDNLPIAGLV